MAGRPGRSRKNASQKTTQTVSTQTSPDRHEADLEFLRNEINQMKLQMALLDKKKSQPDNGDHHRVKVEEKKTVQKTIEKPVVAQADSPQASKIPGKGCTCKGKCNKRSCGCVKKQTACTEWCKCNNSKCENQEADKENDAAANPRVLNLRKNNQREEAAGPSNERVGEVKKPVQGLFSPDTSGIHDYKSAKEFDMSQTMVFGKNPKLVHFESDESDESPEMMKKPKPKQKAENARAESPAPRTTKRGNLRVTSRKEDDSAETDVPKTPKRVTKKAQATAKNVQEAPTKAAANPGGKSKQLKVKENQKAELEVPPINPMMPTRQLPRTPPSHSSSFSASFNRSQVQPPETARVPSPLPMLFKLNQQSTSGLDEPQIDWDEHYRQLVPCRLCSRTFNPDRIEKHESNCKKV